MKAARSVRKLLPWVFSAALFVVGGEVVVRALGILDRMNGFPRRLYQRVDDPRIGYTLRPGVDVVVRGVRARINEHGLRGPSVPPKPDPGVHRVLAVGDSATFGEMVEAEEGWPAVLEAELKSRTADKWEVLNSGVQGWNTRAEVAYIESSGLAFEPETIVVAYNLNDYDFQPVLGAHDILSLDRIVKIPPWSPANWSEFYFALRWFFATRGRAPVSASPAAPTPDTRNPSPVTRAAPSDPPPPFHPIDAYVSALRKHYYRALADERWPALVEAMTRLGELAEGGPRVVVAILPDGDQFASDKPDLVPQQRLARLCDEARLECVDLYERFKAGGGWRLFLDIMHPNAEGYRIVAGAVADRLAPPPAASSGAGTEPRERVALCAGGE